MPNPNTIEDQINQRVRAYAPKWITADQAEEIVSYSAGR